MPAALLFTIIGTLILTYALSDARREAEDRKAAAVAAQLVDQARAFDSFQHADIAERRTTNPAIMNSTVTSFPALAGGPFTGNPQAPFTRERYMVPDYRPSDWTTGRVSKGIAVPFSGEPQHLGILLIDLASDEEHLLPRILAWLDAKSATETKVWRGDVLPWLRTQGVTELPNAEFAIFTAPFASIRPELVRRAPRAGWPDLPLATDIRFTEASRICNTYAPTGCTPINRADTETLSAEAATTNTLSSESITTDALTAGTVQAKGINGQSLTLSRVTATSLTATTADASRLYVPSAPPSAGYRYAVDLTRLTVMDLRTPVAAIEATLTIASGTSSRIATVNTLVGRSVASLPIVSLTTLTASLAGTARASFNNAQVQSCIGCP